MIISYEIIAEEPELAALPEPMLRLRLEAVEQFIRAKTQNCFIVPGVKFTGIVQNGAIVGSHVNVREGDRVEIHDGGINDGLYDVLAVDEGITELDIPLVDDEIVTVRLVKYPSQIVFGALNLLKWDEKHRDRVGLQAETLSRHTVSYDVNADKRGNGYPLGMLGFMKGYMKARF